MRLIQNAMKLMLLTMTATGCSDGYGYDDETGQLGEELEFTQSSDGLVSMDAEHFTTNVAQGSHTWSRIADANASGGSALQATPDKGSSFDRGYTSSSPRLDFKVAFTKRGVHYVWLRGRSVSADSSNSDSAHAGLDGAGKKSADRIQGFTTSYTWTKATADGSPATVNVRSTGVHTVNIWMREDGFVLDKILLTTSSTYTPTGAGPAETIPATQPPPEPPPTTEPPPTSEPPPAEPPPTEPPPTEPPPTQPPPSSLPTCANPSWNASSFDHVYDVGPGQTYATPSDVPWESITAGTLVRIHYRSTAYADKWVLNNAGTASKPIVVLGVPENGKLPRITGSGAKTRRSISYWTEDRAVIKIGGASTPSAGAANVTVECLEISDAKPGLYFTDDSGANVQFRNNAACVFIEAGDGITLRNNVIHGCGNGVFSASASSNLLLSGNYIYDNGNSGSVYEHNSYTESSGITFEFNRYGAPCSGCSGNALKDRSSGTVIRNNWIEGGNRQLDLVESEAGLEANLPEYRSTYVYGNVLIEPSGAGNNQIIHYGGDHDDNVAAFRKGTLYFFHNTVVSTRTDKTTLVRLSTNEERMEARNNVFYTTASGSTFAIVDSSGKADLGYNWLPTGWVKTHGSLSGTVSDTGGNIGGSSSPFADLGGQNFELASGSAAVDKGVSLSGTAYQGYSVIWEYLKHTSADPRNDTGAADIGAYAKD